MTAKVTGSNYSLDINTRPCHTCLPCILDNNVSCLELILYPFYNQSSESTEVRRIMVCILFLSSWLTFDFQGWPWPSTAAAWVLHMTLLRLTLELGLTLSRHKSCIGSAHYLYEVNIWAIFESPSRGISLIEWTRDCLTIGSQWAFNLQVCPWPRYSTRVTCVLHITCSDEQFS